jgi:Trypsin
VNGTTGDGLEVSYASQIVDVSLCATYGQGPGLCPGDSGGPIFLADSSTNPPSARVELGLVGITSSSYGCRDESLPTLNVRASKVSDWVDSVVCNVSRYPVPVDFGCQMSNRTDDDQDSVNRQMVELTVQLELGEYPENFGWILYQVVHENERRRLFATVEHPILSYISSPPNAIVNETVRIPSEASYEILVLDINEESFRNATSLRLWSNGESVEARNVYVTMGTRTYQFTLGSHLTSAPGTLNPTEQPTQPEGSTYLTVFISLDDYPKETGFLVEDLPDSAADESESLSLLYACYPGTFGADMAKKGVQLTVPLRTSAKRVLFTMTDNEHDGLEPPSFYEVWIGPRSSGALVAQGGVFYLEDRHEISIPSHDFRNTYMPSSSPFVADDASTSLAFCTSCWIQMQVIVVIVVLSLFKCML